MTSINIPDMVQVAREYGLIPIPVDIDLSTTAPKLEDLKAVVTPNVYYILMMLIVQTSNDFVYLWCCLPY